MMYKYILGLMVLLTLVQCQDSASQQSKKEMITVTDDLKSKIGQMLIVGFRGTTLDDTMTIKKDIVDRNLGGVIIYEYDVPTKTRPRNISGVDQLAKLNADLQSLREDPLLITIDQEGGKVVRLKEAYGFPAFDVSAKHLGELDSEDSTRYWGALTATSLKAAGVNLNFAPVVDLDSNRCPVIGGINRSFSIDADKVTKHAGFVIEEHRKEGVYTILKHFPGHGSANMDSHKGFTDVTKTWQAEELKPYENLIAADKVDMIMTAHVYNENWDTLPATLSKTVITGMLREQLGWSGVVVSDDMMMGAIADNYGVKFALEKSINAGVDLLIISNNSPKGYEDNITESTIDIIVELVEEGKISVARIEEAHQRIQELKAKL